MWIFKSLTHKSEKKEKKKKTIVSQLWKLESIEMSGNIPNIAKKSES